MAAGGSHKSGVTSGNYSEKAVLNLTDTPKYTPNSGDVVYSFSALAAAKSARKACSGLRDNWPNIGEFQSLTLLAGVLWLWRFLLYNCATSYSLSDCCASSYAASGNVGETGN